MPQKPTSKAVKEALRRMRHRKVKLRLLPGGKRPSKEIVRVRPKPTPEITAAAKQQIQAVKKALPRISLGVLAQSRQKRRKRNSPAINPFDLHAYQALLTPPPQVPRNANIAMDQNINQSMGWAGGLFSVLESAEEEGLAWLGFAFLSLLAQRPEYRRFAEVLGGEMTRKWIKIEAQGDEDKTERIDQLNEEFGRLEVQKAFRKCAIHDNLFGRSHLYVALEIDGKEVVDDREELQSDIGDGLTVTSKVKVTQGSLKALRVIEPIWCYPQYYNSFDPLRADYYNPTSWFVQGKEVHHSRLLKFIGREVPDILKPVYQFGGLSMSQMAKPYVDNWLRTRQSVADLIHSFSVFTLKTDLGEALTLGGEELFKRIDLFNNLRDNQGLMALNFDTEDLMNISAPLGTLDTLQAQTQEHMSSVSGIPLVKLLGISPHGLNASSEGELRVFYDWIHSFQEQFFSENLWKIFHFAQLNIWGEIDPDLTFEYVPLWSMTEDQIVDAMKTEAETDQVLIDTGVISPMEARRRVAADPDTPYAGLDIEDVPDLKEEEEMGLEPKGGRPQPITEASGLDPGGVTGAPTGKEAPKPDASLPTSSGQASRRQKLERLTSDPQRAEKFLRFVEMFMDGDHEPPPKKMLLLARLLRDKVDAGHANGVIDETMAEAEGSAPSPLNNIQQQKLAALMSHSGQPSERARKLARLLNGPTGEPSERISKLAALMVGPMGTPNPRIQRLAKILSAAPQPEEEQLSQVAWSNPTDSSDELPWYEKQEQEAPRTADDAKPAGIDAKLLAQDIGNQISEALKAMPTPAVNIPAPIVNITLPKKGIERTCNVKHDEKGRIISFDRITVDEGDK